MIEDVASGREAENQNRELEELQQWQLYDKFVYSKAADTTCSSKVISISSVLCINTCNDLIGCRG